MLQVIVTPLSWITATVLDFGHDINLDLATRQETLILNLLYGEIVSNFNHVRIDTKVHICQIKTIRMIRMIELQKIPTRSPLNEGVKRTTRIRTNIGCSTLSFALFEKKKKKKKERDLSKANGRLRVSRFGRRTTEEDRERERENRNGCCGRGTVLGRRNWKTGSSCSTMATTTSQNRRGCPSFATAGSLHPASVTTRGCCERNAARTPRPSFDFAIARIRDT
ncbi:hypothetical protein K0M31_007695 [Melipona bicolor]|uniref:Uncharacterized protein n=1 Tax=Melipona bicolor TaxID=60889 RepID=A0AA40GC05_9HYME|nr:hypothetical protein K0M31_007695 [Melipona bicolor]